MADAKGLHIYASNRLETLAETLAEIVRIPLSSPLQAETIIVQSKGMERWISLSLAHHNGICANVSFPFPNLFVQDIVRLIYPEVNENNPFDRDVMIFRIMAQMPNCMDEPEFEDVKTYLQGDDRGLKLHQLSENIADTFDQYLVFRPEMIFAWESGKSGHWQAQLWRMLVSDTEIPHRAQLRTDLIHALQNPPDIRKQLPERINIFGISHLPRFHMEIFAALSCHMSVNLFLMNPCREYWGDIVSNRESKRIRTRYDKRGIPETDLHLEAGNRLLATMGAQARDFFRIISGMSSDFEDAYVEPGDTTLLSCIQTDILNLEDRHRRLNEGDMHDSSIQFHSCHSPMREIEVLHNRLLSMFEENPELAPEDIIVMTPDIDRYASYIQAVFGSPNNESMKIPFSIADRSIRRERHLIEALICLMALQGTRFGAARIKSLLEFPSIRKRFDLSEEDLEIIEQWIRETGIRWGIDAEDRKRIGLPPYPENTWQFGIDRLLLGFAMPGYGQRLYAGVLPYDHIEGQEAKVLGKFIDFIERIVRWIRVFDHRKPLTEWETAFLKLIDELFVVEDDAERDLQMLRSHIGVLSHVQTLAGFDAMVTFDVIRAFLTDRLEKEGGETGFITGGVTFCTMLPMRSIPFDVVCLIGMDNDAFPRESRVFGFDLMRKYPKPGDRSRRNDDRYLFLEAIISARQRLYISYVGQSIQDNSSIPPSVLVSELMDYIAEGFIGAGSECVVRHPLQAFSPDYFTADHPRLFSYSESDLTAAVSLLESKASAPFISTGLPAPTNEWRQIEIRQLARFLFHPARFLLQHRLGIYLEDAPAAVSERENFHLEPLQRYMLGQNLIEGRQSGIDRDQMHRVFQAGGTLPHGNVGAVIFKDLNLDVETFLKRVERFDAGVLSASLDVDLRIGPFHLFGRLDHRYQKGLLKIRYGNTNAKDLLHAWVFHLLSCAERLNTGNDPQKTFLLCQDSGWVFAPVSDCNEPLRRLLEHYWRGLSAPLHFFPESALAYCRQILRNPDSRHDAILAAHRKWEGAPYSAGWGETDDPYYTLCFKHTDPLDESFEALATLIFEPLLRHCRKLSM